MKQKFTLIELIVVIAILGILASIIIPNIKDTQTSAKLTAIYNNIRNTQTAVDMYALEHNGNYPTVNKPTELIPEPIDFTLLYPKYLRDYPNTEGVKCWVDFMGKVWASTVGSPKNVQYNGNIISWETVEGVREYQIYELKGYNAVLGNSKKHSLKFLTTTTDTSFIREEGKTYLVNAKDSIGLESAPVGKGYVGFPNDYSVKKPLQPKEETKPVAKITMTPSKNINSLTFITWSYEESYHPEGLNIVEVEWENKQDRYDAGTHTVRLRVKDEKNIWSDWAEKTFTVENVSSTSKTFEYTGNVQEFEAPYTGVYLLEVWGAQGGMDTDGNGNIVYGGKGGYSKGEVRLTQGQKLYVYVGEKGGNYDTSYNAFNGGGKGGKSLRNRYGSGGGGATDIRTIGGNWDNKNSLNSRLIVAGGGGGADGDAYSKGIREAGAGGGGYYGGYAHSMYGGSGGSGYIGGVENGYSEVGVNSGHGKAVITFLGN